MASLLPQERPTKEDAGVEKPHEILEFSWQCVCKSKYFGDGEQLRVQRQERPHNFSNLESMQYPADPTTAPGPN